MFDENGDAHRRRKADPWWRFLIPVGGSLTIALFSWGVSLETRISNMAAIQLERGPVIGKMQAQLDAVEQVANDPSPRPEAKVMINRIETAHEHLEERLNRLEERFNNFHQFLLQVKPTIIPPSKRGEHPFKLEEQG